MPIFFYTDPFTGFRYLNTMACLENIDPATSEETKGFLLHSIHYLSISTL